MLLQRVLTAVVLLALLVAATVGLSGFTFALLLAAVLLGAAGEWTRFIGLTDNRTKAGYLLSLALMLVALFPLLGLSPQAESLDQLRVNIVLLLALLFWLLVLSLMRGYPHNTRHWNEESHIALMGVLVLIPTWVGLVQLKFLASGGWLVLAVIGLVSVADIGAYFSGRQWGERKLAPALSPKKTWAGLWGSLAASMLYAGLCLYLTNRYFYPLSPGLAGLLLLATAPLVLISIAGDLFESMLKRNRGLKDSGSILPGHGGIMDRIDSLTATVPLFTLILTLIS